MSKRTAAGIRDGSKVTPAVCPTSAESTAHHPRCSPGVAGHAPFLTQPPQTTLGAVALVCSLNPSSQSSSSQLLAEQTLKKLSEHGVESGLDDVVRVVDHDVKPGVSADMGDGDGWPAIREKVLAAD